MELFQTDLHYILVDGDHSLWCNRSNGRLEPKTGVDLSQASKEKDVAHVWDPVCLGVVHGFIGKIKLHPDSEWRLLLVKQSSPVCQLADQYDIFKVNKICILTLSTSEGPGELELEPCRKNHNGKKADKAAPTSDSAQMSLRGTWNSIKTAAENVKSKKKETKDREKYERRILEELLKMFNDSDSFYYSHNFDLTTNLQRQSRPSYCKAEPLWKRADERFFWNKHMLADLIEAEDVEARHWVVPMMQGYVQMEQCLMDFEEDHRPSPETSSSVDFPIGMKLEPLGYHISIISRRSRHRAGTRSRKRGIDADGACANYVETEQIIEFSPHLVSFVQVRGSIPVFWSQTGFKYRPPPRLDKDENTSHEAFVKHFQEQLDLFERIAVITLAELAGKEHELGDAFLGHVIRYNAPSITYVTFDFHEYCRGMKFENVSILTDGIKDIIKDQRYCWVDTKGVICEQQGVLRVNCIDCLDRTNVVQTAVARVVMETQFRKLGLLPPEENLPSSCRRTYQQLWANNGDAISRQYAGTAALKGDFTRTGERKLSGLMKDGVNSANRYYLRFRDAYRQAAVDLTLGQPVPESLLAPTGDVDEMEGAMEQVTKEEDVRMVVEDTKRMLIVEPEYCQGGWPLINADSVEGDSDRQDMDIILLLSQRSVYVAWYDDEEESVTQYQCIYLEDIDRIEIGTEPGVFKSKHICIRIYYHYLAQEGLFHTFRAPTSRFFNNAVTAQFSEEVRETFRIIADAFQVAQSIMSLELDVVDRHKLEKKKHPPHPDITDVHKQQQENSLVSIKLPRDISTDMRSSSPNHLHENSPTSGKGSDSRSLQSTSPSRSKSPLSFLHNIPKPSLPAATSGILNKTLTSTRVALTKSNLKVNLQTLDLIKKMKMVNSKLFVRNPGNRHKISAPTEEIVSSDMSEDEIREEELYNDNEGEDESDHSSHRTSVILDDSKKDVLFGDCGILATSPKQLIQSSINLTSDPKRSLSLDVPDMSPRVRLSSKTSQDSEEKVFSFDEDATIGKEESNALNHEGEGENDEYRDENVFKMEDMHDNVEDDKEEEDSNDLDEEVMRATGSVSSEDESLTRSEQKFKTTGDVDVRRSAAVQIGNSLKLTPKIDAEGLTNSTANTDKSAIASTAGGSNAQSTSEINSICDVKEHPQLKDIPDIVVFSRHSKVNFDENEGDEGEHEDDDEAYCVIHSEEVQTILNKCQQLHHPNMKTSLSDSSLSLGAPQDVAGLSSTNALDNNDGLMAKWKLKMAGRRPRLLKPTTESSLISKNHIRKSQRAMEVFEKMMREKLPGKECKSRFIFI